MLEETQTSVWRVRRQLPGRRAAGQSWVEHLADVLVNKLQ